MSRGASSPRPELAVVAGAPSPACLLRRSAGEGVLFYVWGPPVAWQRARSSGKRRWTDPRVAAFKQRVSFAAAAVVSHLAAGPVRVRLEFVLERPRRLCRKSDPDGLLVAPVRPDVDNYCKAVLDALNGVAYVDDGQVIELLARKWYAERAGRPRVEVAVWPA